MWKMIPGSTGRGVREMTHEGKTANKGTLVSRFLLWAIEAQSH